MLIGEVAQRAGVSARTVRHYETLGLIRAERRANGYRDYGDDSPRLVMEARLLSHLGIRLDRTAPFLQCLVAGNPKSDDCPDTVAEYRDAIAELGDRIADLTARRDTLVGLLESALQRSVPRCEFSSAGGEA